MRYLYMQPSQIRDAVKRNIPVVLPLGVIEYHAEHLPIGTDYFIAEKVLNMVEEQYPDDMVLLPPFYYGTATCAVADPENNGTINVSPEKIIPVAEDIFKGLLEVGFRNIHCFIAHQTEGFYQGMPTDLAFRTAARHVIFEWLEKESGEGWWGTEKFSNYYDGSNNPFKWIQIHTSREHDVTGEHKRKFPGDHAGILETSETLCMYPELVELDRIDGSIWYARTGKDATAAYGDAALEAAADDLELSLYPEKK